MSDFIKINDNLSVSGQIALDEFATLAGLGYKAVINNRPEGEEATQPASAEEAAAAANAGLAYAHIPVTGPSIREQDVRDLQAVLGKANGPVLAHCRSGTRSVSLFAIGEVLDGRMKREDLPAFGAKHGFDMRMADGWLASNGH